MLAVTDSGIVMDDKTQLTIFEPFFTTKENGKGTGLGLATVYGIVQQSGAMIKVESKPGKGSSFRVYFPCVQEKADQTASSKPPRPAGGTETILVVEDDVMVRKVTVKILERLGYNVLTAASGGDAMVMSEIHKGKIDLLLTDVIMPHINGKELAKKLVTSHPDLKVLYMSGYTKDTIAKHDVLEQGVHIISKPFSSTNLAVRIRDILDD